MNSDEKATLSALIDGESNHSKNVGFFGILILLWRWRRLKAGS
jgi:hypothetical protein